MTQGADRLLAIEGPWHLKKNLLNVQSFSLTPQTQHLNLNSKLNTSA